MKVPKYIKQALESRANYAERFTHLDCIIFKFLDKHGILHEEYDICGGCESYVNPHASSDRLLRAIENHKELQNER